MSEDNGACLTAPGSIGCADEAQGLRPSGNDPSRDRRYLLVKRGLFYRPDNCGYTGIKKHAGRYYASDADELSGVSAVHEDDAPMFAPKCFHDVKVDYLLARINDLEAALGLALAQLFEFEPGDSRAVSNEFVAMASVEADCANAECMEIIRAAAQAIDARSGETGTGSIGEADESAVPQGCAQGPDILEWRE